MVFSAYLTYVHKSVSIINTKDVRNAQSPPRCEMLKYSGGIIWTHTNAWTTSDCNVKSQTTLYVPHPSDGIWRAAYTVTWWHYQRHHSTVWDNWRTQGEMLLSTLPPLPRMSVLGVMIIAVNHFVCFRIWPNLSPFVKMLWKVVFPGLFVHGPHCDKAWISAGSQRNEIRAKFAIF